MKTDVLRVDAESPERLKIKTAAQLLKDGKIVAIPTETVYGLAVNAQDKQAVDRLYEIKKRPKDKPFTIQIADLSQLKDYTEEIETYCQEVKECLSAFC